MNEQQSATAVLERQDGHIAHEQWMKMGEAPRRAPIAAALDRLFVAVGGLR